MADIKDASYWETLYWEQVKLKKNHLMYVEDYYKMREYYQRIIEELSKRPKGIIRLME